MQFLFIKSSSFCKWGKVFVRVITFALPCKAKISVAVFNPKYAGIVVTPFSFANLAKLVAGSTPKTFLPFFKNPDKSVPSLDPISMKSYLSLNIITAQKM